jgi:hypothetical protein
MGTLIRDHHLTKEDADACYKIIIQIVLDYNVYSESSGHRYLRLDKLVLIRFLNYRTSDERYIGRKSSPIK